MNIRLSLGELFPVDKNIAYLIIFLDACFLMRNREIKIGHFGGWEFGEDLERKTITKLYCFKTVLNKMGNR